MVGGFGVLRLGVVVLVLVLESSASERRQGLQSTVGIQKSDPVPTSHANCLAYSATHTGSAGSCVVVLCVAPVFVVVRCGCVLWL